MCVCVCLRADGMGGKGKAKPKGTAQAQTRVRKVSNIYMKKYMLLLLPLPSYTHQVYSHHMLACVCAHNIRVCIVVGILIIIAVECKHHIYHHTHTETPSSKHISCATHSRATRDATVRAGRSCAIPPCTRACLCGCAWCMQTHTHTHTNQTHARAECEPVHAASRREEAEARIINAYLHVYVSFLDGARV